MDGDCCALPGLALGQQVELRILEEIVVLQDADDLQRIGLLP
jgi:hypothetical protein